MIIPQGASLVIRDCDQNGAGIEPHENQITRADLIGLAQPVGEVHQCVQARRSQGDVRLLWPARRALGLWRLLGHSTLHPLPAFVGLATWLMTVPMILHLSIQRRMSVRSLNPHTGSRQQENVAFTRHVTWMEPGSSAAAHHG